jgi:hypothetical protein
VLVAVRQLSDGHIPSWRGSRERYALPPAAASSCWLLPLLSAAGPGPHPRDLPGAVTVPAAVTIASVAAARISLTPAAASLIPIAASPALNPATPTLGNTENTLSRPVSTSSRATAPRGPASSTSTPPAGAAPAHPP